MSTVGQSIARPRQMAVAAAFSGAPLRSSCVPGRRRLHDSARFMERDAARTRPTDGSRDHIRTTRTCLMVGDRCSSMDCHWLEARWLRKSLRHSQFRRLTDLEIVEPHFFMSWLVGSLLLERHPHHSPCAAGCVTTQGPDSLGQSLIETPCVIVDKNHHQWMRLF